MSLKYALAFASYISILVRANPLRSPGPRAVALQARTQSGDLYPLSTSNDSATSSDLMDDIHIECNGSSYGFDLDITDCELAKAFVPANSEVLVWAERHTSSLKRYQPLPYRSMGEKAICYVETSLINGATSGKASTNQIRNAAAMIRHQCYSNGRLQGGIATNMGYDNQLAVVMGSYNAPSGIQCQGKLPAPYSCEVVLEEMPADTTVQTFGPRADVSVTVPLPYTFRPADNRCQIRIFSTSSTSASDKALWYEVWEATVAIWSVCVRNYKGGSLHNLGDHGNLLLAMTTPLSYPTTEDTTVHDISNASRIQTTPLRYPTTEDTTVHHISNGSQIQGIKVPSTERWKGPEALRPVFRLVPP